MVPSLLHRPTFRHHHHHHFQDLHRRVVKVKSTHTTMTMIPVLTHHAHAHLEKKKTMKITMKAPHKVIRGGAVAAALVPVPTTILVVAHQDDTPNQFSVNN